MTLRSSVYLKVKWCSLLNLIYVWSISLSSWMKSLLHRDKSNWQCFYNWMSHLCNVDKWLVIIILHLESIQKSKKITDKGQRKQCCMSTWKQTNMHYTGHTSLKWLQKEIIKGNKQLDMAYKWNDARERAPQATSS